MDLNFRTLKADEIDVRIGSVNRGGVNLLLYKDARVDMNLLDTHVGSLNWRRKHEVIDGKLFCTVSIYDPDKKEWISKQDVGTESYTEKEKGQSSDAFKRACVNWSIGRELYTAPTIFFYSNQLKNYSCENGKYKCFDTFSVVNIQYDNNRTIANVTIKNNASGVTATFGHPLPTDISHNTIASSTNNWSNSLTPDGKDKIGDDEKRQLLNQCHTSNIDIAALLAKFKIATIDDLNHHQFNYFISHWDTITKRLLHNPK